MRGVPVAVCMTCGRRAFPAPLLCPSCGGGESRREWVETGTVEEVTLLRRTPGRALDEPVRLGSVRLATGPRVIARLEHGLAAGARARLELQDGALVAYGDETASGRSWTA